MKTRKEEIQLDNNLGATSLLCSFMEFHSGRCNLERLDCPTVSGGDGDSLTESAPEMCPLRTHAVSVTGK